MRGKDPTGVSGKEVTSEWMDMVVVQKQILGLLAGIFLFLLFLSFRLFNPTKLYHK